MPDGDRPDTPLVAPDADVVAAATADATDPLLDELEGPTRAGSLWSDAWRQLRRRPPHPAHRPDTWGLN